MSCKKSIWVFDDIDEMFEYMQTKLGLTKLEYFVGGSCNFGYDTPTSDIDTFIYCKDASEFQLVRNFIEKRMKGVRVSDVDYPGAKQYKVNGDPYLHINLYLDLQKFLKVKKDNEIVLAFLQKNPAIPALIKTFRYYNMIEWKGTTIFHALLQLAKAEVK